MFNALHVICLSVKTAFILPKLKVVAQEMVKKALLGSPAGWIRTHMSTITQCAEHMHTPQGHDSRK